MTSKFEHPGIVFEVVKKNNEVHVNVKAAWVTNSTQERRILLTTRKIQKILARHYNLNELQVVKEDHVSNLNDNSEQERTGQWIFSLPVKKQVKSVKASTPAKVKQARVKKSTNLTK